MIKQIKIPAVYARGLGDYVHPTAIFDLGLGPCGKVVETLEIHYGDTFVAVTQICSDTEKKVFMYRVCDLVGRIEVTYA